jgi:pyroglutamyl-peptidase
MKKIILTGFDIFGPYCFNPSKDLAFYYNSKFITGQEQIIGIVLPCTYFGAFKELAPIIDRENPYAVISVGFSSSVKGIRIETTFKNLMNGKYPDAAGYDPKNVPIENGAPETLISTADNIHLLGLLYERNIPVEISTDADAFICNYLGYSTTKKIIDEHLPIKNMFIHIPWTDDYRGAAELHPDKIFIKKQKLHAAIEILIKNI